MADREATLSSFIRSERGSSKRRGRRIYRQEQTDGIERDIKQELAKVRIKELISEIDWYTDNPETY